MLPRIQILNPTYWNENWWISVAFPTNLRMTIEPQSWIWISRKLECILTMLCTFLVVGIIEMITMIIIMTNQRVAMLFLTKVSFECLSLCVSNLILSLYCFKRTDTSNIFGHRISMTWQNSKLQDWWFKFLTWTGTCQILFFWILWKSWSTLIQ